MKPIQSEKVAKAMIKMLPMVTIDKKYSSLMK